MQLIFMILVLTVFLGLVIPLMSLAPWFPCKTKDLKRILDISKLKKGEVFYDLGCGDGKTVLYIANNCDVKKSVGVELSWPMYLVCKFRQFLSKNKKLEFRFANLYNTDISDADVIYVWGMINTLTEKFVQKLKSQAKPGTRVISYVFKIKGLVPIIIDKPSKKDTTIYMYIL